MPSHPTRPAMTDTGVRTSQAAKIVAMWEERKKKKGADRRRRNGGRRGRQADEQERGEPPTFVWRSENPTRSTTMDSNERIEGHGSEWLRDSRTVTRARVKIGT